MLLEAFLLLWTEASLRLEGCSMQHVSDGLKPKACRGLGIQTSKLTSISASHATWSAFRTMCGLRWGIGTLGQLRPYRINVVGGNVSRLMCGERLACSSEAGFSSLGPRRPSCCGERSEHPSSSGVFEVVLLFVAAAAALFDMILPPLHVLGYCHVFRS